MLLGAARNESEEPLTVGYGWHFRRDECQSKRLVMSKIFYDDLVVRSSRLPIIWVYFSHVCFVPEGDVIQRSIRRNLWPLRLPHSCLFFTTRWDARLRGRATTSNNTVTKEKSFRKWRHFHDYFERNLVRKAFWLPHLSVTTKKAQSRIVLGRLIEIFKSIKKGLRYLCYNNGNIILQTRAGWAGMSSIWLLVYANWIIWSSVTL